MKSRTWIPGFASIVRLSTLLLVVPITLSANGNSLPPQSVYNLQVAIEDQLGETTGLDRYKGQPVLLTMFYSSCPHVCPMLISTIKLTESKLSVEERAQLRILTISIDPERDTPANLHKIYQRHSVDSGRWSMVRPKSGDVRKIAGVLGIKYKQLPDGEFNHTTKIVLLDRDGTQVASTDQLGRPDAAFLEAIRTSLQ